MPSLKHIHKYKQTLLGGEKILREQIPGTKRYKKTLIKTGGSIVYKCMIPGCTHFIDKGLLEGRESICWICGDKMVITSEAAKLVKPRHWDCRPGAAEAAEVGVDATMDDFKFLLG
jgi:hypothetical protein